MKRILALAAVVALTAACATLPPLQEGQHPQSFTATVVKKVGAKYLLFLPRGYAANKNHLWPLILFLHGVGERGGDLAKVKVNGPPGFLDQRPDFPFVVISPQAPEDASWSPDMLNALLNDALKRLRVDPNRVYLTGLSMGGYGAYELAADFPGRFAAVAPISGAGDPADACRFKNLPLQAYHGGKDGVVPPANDQAMVAAINACGGHAKMNLYPEAGHDVWKLVYADQSLYNWFLRQTRGHPAD